MAFISLPYKEINAIKVLNISDIDQYSEWNIDNRLQLKSGGMLDRIGKTWEGLGNFGRNRQLTLKNSRQQFPLHTPLLAGAATCASYIVDRVCGVIS